jgi:hypothetical protein
MELDKHSMFRIYDTSVDGNPMYNIDGNNEKKTNY